MTLQINFDHPAILSAYLDQALPKMKLEGERGRIQVGSQGGLGYALFERSFVTSQLPKQFTLPASFGRIGATVRFLEAVATYIEGAAQHAREYDFGFVTANESGILTNEPYSADSLIYLLNMGNPVIESQERFETFLRMVQEGNGLEQRYAKVKELAEKLKE